MKLGINNRGLSSQTVRDSSGEQSIDPSSRPRWMLKQNQSCCPTQSLGSWAGSPCVGLTVLLGGFCFYVLCFMFCCFLLFGLLVVSFLSDIDEP